MKQYWKKGSFTIEASIIIPFVLCIMVYVLQMGIQFYQESIERECMEGVEKWDAVSTFYRIQMLKEMEEEWAEDGT